jgi:hypothetical protein
VVDLQEIEGGRRQTGADDPVAAHLGVVADPFEQRLAPRGVPRLRSAMARAPPFSIATSSSLAERRTIVASSSTS